MLNQIHATHQRPAIYGPPLLNPRATWCSPWKSTWPCGGCAGNDHRFRFPPPGPLTCTRSPRSTEKIENVYGQQNDRKMESPNRQPCRRVRPRPPCKISPAVQHGIDSTTITTSARAVWGAIIFIPCARPGHHTYDARRACFLSCWPGWPFEYRPD